MISREEFDKKNEVPFPAGKIVTLEGRMLDCYPLPQEDVNVVDDEMKLDTTGTYLAVGRRPKPEPPKPEEVEAKKELFVDNAFYLLAHKERIMSDSRMFLCPVAVQSGLAYTGTSGFTRPTLGVYLEWWSAVPNAMQVDKEGHKLLVYRLAGSPLSGSNRCAAIRDDGKREIVTLIPFGGHFRPFTLINCRYNEAKYMYQAYTLQNVLDILSAEDEGNTDFALKVELEFMTHEADLANTKLAQQVAECRQWQQKCYDTIGKYNEKRICDFYAEYERAIAVVDAETDKVRQQRRYLKAQLKSGSLSGKAYQQKLTPLNKHIKELELEVASFRFGRKVREAFPDEELITFDMIQSYVLNKRREQADKHDKE